MNQLQTRNNVMTVEADLLEQVLSNTVQRQQEVMRTQHTYQPVLRSTFITEPQKKYIVHLRGEARKVGLNTLADKKVSNRQAASDYIGELLKSIREKKVFLAKQPAKKPCGCGRK